MSEAKCKMCGSPCDGGWGDVCSRECAIDETYRSEVIPPPRFKEGDAARWQKWNVLVFDINLALTKCRIRFADGSWKFIKINELVSGMNELTALRERVKELEDGIKTEIFSFDSQDTFNDPTGNADCIKGSARRLKQLLTNTEQQFTTEQPNENS